MDTGMLSHPCKKQRMSGDIGHAEWPFWIPFFRALCLGFAYSECI